MLVFLHVRCVPHQNSQRLFWASVWNIWTDVEFLRNWYCHEMRGGSESHSIQCPVKTVVCDCDIGTDHPDVPAKRFNFWFTSIILFNCTLWESVPDGSLQWSSSCLVCVLFCVWCYVCIVVYVLLYSITICPSLGRLLPNLFWLSLSRTHVRTQKTIG